ncbi:Two-component serine/threonine-protein kinase PK-1 with PASTA sensors [metagenome]|uniref:Two-component serine/threonine-protein kinase PK-1 with PASTA sensors n=1 Tax=metagenome TaxID=256318 RepID=A0A2P2BW64_9ZZZZ
MDVDAQGPSQPDRSDGRNADPLSGRVLEGRYRIGSRIARGGMASVYEATDIRLDRLVAVKIMHPGLGDDEEFAARFVREARAAARLSHPNVVGVFDQGTDHGTVFLAMEFVPGHTLRDVIRKESPMPPLRAMSLIDPVLSALAAAHRAGLIHRDIKPENVLIADDGRIKVADFGLAKAISTDTQHTATGGVLIGTVSYLAPELVIDGKADARADVYAAGVMLYEMLTGHKPHEGESPIAVAYKHVHEDVPAPSSEVPDLPAYVDALVARGTSRDRNNRPADASVFLHQVHRVRQALAEGVDDDPELTADLMPLPSAEPVDDEIAYVPEDLHDSTLERIPAVREHTVALSSAPATPDSSPRSALPVPVRSDQGPPPKRSRRGLILLVAALVLAVGAGAGAWWFGAGRYTPTPGVIGLTEAAAVKKVEAEGLSAEVSDRLYSETVAQGRVISTDPGPGAKVLSGGTVDLVVSLGKERYDVPKLRGKTEDQAQDAILAANLDFGRSIEQFSETIPEGTVIGSDPKAGVSVKPDTAVDLILSKGPKPIKIRDFTGRSADRAESVLTGLGLVVDRTEEYNNTIPEGRVISQDPDSGTLFKGDDIHLVVSQGPELVEIPGGLVASGVESARSTLEDLGFDVEVKQSDNSLGLGFVYSVDPGQGEMVPMGSTVTLYLI